MTRLFRGRFDCKVDQKGRLIFPSAFREVLPKGKSDFVITNSLSNKKKCLDIYTLSEWEKLEKKISKMPSLKKEVQMYQRFYISGGQVSALDNQHRLSLPGNLRKYAALDGEIVLVGMGKKIELWPSNVWNEMQEQMADSFEDILAVVADLEEGLGG